MRQRPRPRASTCSWAPARRSRSSTGGSRWARGSASSWSSWTTRACAACSSTSSAPADTHPSVTRTRDPRPHCPRLLRDRASRREQPPRPRTGARRRRRRHRVRLLARARAPGAAPRAQAARRCPCSTTAGTSALRMGELSLPRAAARDQLPHRPLPRHQVRDAARCRRGARAVPRQRIDDAADARVVAPVEAAGPARRRGHGHADVLLGRQAAGGSRRCCAGLRRQPRPAGHVDPAHAAVSPKSCARCTTPGCRCSPGR